MVAVHVQINLATPHLHSYIALPNWIAELTIRRYSYTDKNIYQSHKRRNPLVDGIVHLPTKIVTDIEFCISSHIRIRAYIVKYTVQCRNNAVNFPTNPHNGNAIARPHGHDSDCPIWSQVWLKFCCCHYSIVCNSITWFITERRNSLQNFMFKTEGIILLSWTPLIYIGPI